ncbi:MAG: hypothetical protein JW809_07200 [Pirellulales bacterium]|nr:hypothetical protein [Pirellulales bacterium]
MTPEGLRKAAILIDTLDAPAADALLERMAADQADLVRRTVVQLGPIDPKERNRVVAEFLKTAPGGGRAEPSGIELDGSAARRLVERVRPSGGLPRAENRPPDGPPFRCLRQAEQAEIARVLSGERPQTIALVLSHLPPARAGAVLVQFPASAQAEIVRRLVDLEETDPEVLHEVERGIEARLVQLPLARRRAAGREAVHGILKAADRTVGRQILDNLVAHDPRLAHQFLPERPETNPIAFDDLAGFSGAALATIAETADPELLALALVGAPPILADRLLRQLPYHRSRDIHHQLGHLAPTRLSDVELARQALADLAFALSLEGRIELDHETPSTLQMTA